MSVMTTNETPASTVTEPEVFRRTRNRFNQWLQAEFDRHYHTMRDGGYRSFLKKNHPTELVRYDEACEALRRGRVCALCRTADAGAVPASAGTAKRGAVPAAT